jgi:hypothetical protein
MPPRPVWNTAWNPSPVVFTTEPPCRATASRRISSWRANAACIASGCSSHRRVEPSMSVNKNVTVPDGISTTTQTIRPAIHSGTCPVAAGMSPNADAQPAGALSQNAGPGRLDPRLVLSPRTGVPRPIPSAELGPRQPRQSRVVSSASRAVSPIRGRRAKPSGTPDRRAGRRHRRRLT